MRLPALYSKVVVIGCLLLGLAMAGCGGGGGGSQTPSAPTTVGVQGKSHAGTLALPLALARCYFDNLQDGTRTAVNNTTRFGALDVQLPPDVQGFVRCRHTSLSRLTLSAFISTVGHAAGTVMQHEDITPATTVIADHITATNPADPQSRKVELLGDLARREPSITLLVETATTVFQAMLQAGVDSSADFSGDGTDDGEGGDADAGDDGGAGGEAGDGGEFSPIPNAVCTFSLDFAGQVRANTVLGDMFADGKVDRPDLQPIAEQINSAIDAPRRRAIRQSFAALFPTGLGTPLQTLADGEDSPTPGAYFLPYPVGVPGVIRCRPSDQENLVLTTCVRAREPNEMIGLQDVTPVTSVICQLVTDVQQADVRANRDMTKTDLESRISPLRIFLSEDRNGNGVQDADERDKNGDGDFATVVEIESDEPLTDANRDLALLVSMSATIFDTMRIKANNLPTDSTFEQAREDLFNDGRFNAEFLPLETAVEDVLADTANQSVLGTDDGINEVVTAATTGTLRGTVMDDSGQPVAGVQVVVSQNGVEVEVAGNPATTEADGTFQINDIPIGDTTVTAFLGEFEVLRVNTNVVAIVTIDLEIMPTPTIELTPSALVFGDVELGSARTLPVIFTNTGMADLTISVLAVDTTTSHAFQLGNSLTLPVVVAPGASVPVEVMYDPTAVGVALSTLRVTSDALNTPEASVALIGTSVPQPVALLEVLPMSLSLGTVEVGTSNTGSVRMRNAGTADLIVQSLTIDSPSGAVFGLDRLPRLPVRLVPGSELVVQVRYQPETAGFVTGLLHVGSNADMTPEIMVALSGTGVPVPQPKIEVSTPSLSFGSVQIQPASEGAVTVTKSVQVWNRGTATLTLSALQVESAVGSEFTLGQAPDLPTEVPPASSVNIEVQYRPSIIGSVTGALHIRSNDTSKADLTVALNGRGVPTPRPQIVANSQLFDFGDVGMGQFQTLTLNISNPGNDRLEVTTIAIEEGAASGFALDVSQQAALSIEPNSSADVSVRFTPGLTGTVTGVLRIEHNVAGTLPLEIPLIGTGVAVAAPQMVVSPLVWSYGVVELGQPQTTTITIANPGTADLMVNELTVVSATPEAFRLGAAVPSERPVPVAAGESLTVPVVFNPQSPGLLTAQLRISGNALNTPTVEVDLGGTGVEAPQVTVSPLLLEFDEVEIGQSPAPSFVVQIVNSGGADLTVTSVTLEGAPSEEFALNVSPATQMVLIPDAQMLVEVTYSPTQPGRHTDRLLIATDDPLTPVVMVDIGGTGVAVPVAQIEVTPLSLDYGLVEAGSIVPQTVVVRNPGTAVLTISALTVSSSTSGSEVPDVPPVFGLSAGSSLPSPLPPGGTATIEVTYEPRAVVPSTGMLEIISDAVGSPAVIVELSGTGVAVPVGQLQVTPPMLSFGAVELGTLLPPSLSVTVSNIGTAALSLTSVTVESGDASVFTLTPGAEIVEVMAPGDSQVVSVSYQPVSAGPVSGVLRLGTDLVGTPEVTVPLDGTGVAVPRIEWQPAMLSFGDVTLGVPQSLTLTLRNAGTANLDITGLTLAAGATSGLALTNPPVAPLTLAPQETRTVDVLYAPTVAGPVTGTIRVQSNSAGIPEAIVPLQGNGVVGVEPRIWVQPSPVAFGEVEVGQSRVISVQVSNLGATELELSDVILAAGLSSEVILNNRPILPVVLAFGESVSFNLVYTPTTTGLVSGNITLRSNSAGGPDKAVVWQGTGIAAQIEVTPASLTFGEVVVGQSLLLPLEIRNVGLATLRIISVGLEAHIDPEFAVGATPRTVPPGGSATINVIYEPTSVGPLSGILQIESNAFNTPVVGVTLGGTGVPATAPAPTVVQ